MINNDIKENKSKINLSVLSQAVRTALTNKRTTVAHTKDRGDVRGGGIKPWKQKGTGRARAGSSRSPIWRGGGITFGPRSTDNFSLMMPKKMRGLAIKNAFQIKDDAKKLVKIDSLVLESPKTKILEKYIVDLTGSYSCLIVVSPETYKSYGMASRNLPNIKMVPIFNASLVDILNYEFVVLDKDAQAQYLEVAVEKPVITKKAGKND
jgi:large subunit ribosomal protein L4